MKVGQNLTGQQKERWGGDYSLTVLNEAISKIYSWFSVTSSIELASKYPKVNSSSILEEIIRDIGLELLETRDFRNAETLNAIISRYNISVPTQLMSAAQTATSTTNDSGDSSASASNNASLDSTNVLVSNGTSGSPQTSQQTQNSGQTGGPRAYSTNDPKHVSAQLKKFSPRGHNRQKVVSLRDELKKLKINDNPIAFCLLLRSIFEISAKIYANEKSISLVKSGSKEKKLAELLRDITNDLTNNNSNTAMVKVLHGAMTEIAKTDGLLSITSMNQLVHNTTFSIIPQDICTLFGNIYPLLESMN